MTPNANSRWSKRAVNPALWAAYGDALGFITELATPSLLFARTGERFVERTIEWRRRIGGKFGVMLKLPSGCYSDDTQLRLAVSRSIGPDGYFDVASFASIELPVWYFYALGAGNASQAAG
jgi:ADP-ribosylglycohydrolase